MAQLKVFLLVLIIVAVLCQESNVVFAEYSNNIQELKTVFFQTKMPAIKQLEENILKYNTSSTPDADPIEVQNLVKKYGAWRRDIAICFQRLQNSGEIQFPVRNQDFENTFETLCNIDFKQLF
eukprot:TRINITY_DN11957_c0_g1_i1.p1 TRINITY_DN11957_c0_g1~~TRINITY_DN11957_c0_g1_i1.p1  ORF type:complete len:123 (-),score=41.25 TRINITY_DN11957_c0_g1_i1:610-978(-)